MKGWKQNFFTIWAGQAFSQFSSSVLQFAIVWYLTDQTGSALVLSAAMMMGFLPQGVLGPFIGGFIDRYSRKRIMIISDLLISAASFVMVIAGWMGTLSTGLILAVLLCRSIGSAFHTPCLQAVTPQIVPEGQLVRCAGYSQALESVSQILSPVLAAVLYSSWSLSGIIFLDVIGALAAVCTLGITVIPGLPRGMDEGKVQILREAKEGFQILCTNKGMLGLVLISTLYTLALMPTSALFPLMSMSYFNGTSTHASIVEVVFSVGLLSGSLVLSRWGGTKTRIYTIIGSFLLYGILYAVNGYPSLMGTAFSTYYISLSIFLGFAISFPDMQVLLYFIIPIKIKWLAYLDVALLAYSMITSIMSGNWAGCVVILCSLANVLVFFLMTRKGKRSSFQQNRRRKEFKKAVSRGEAEYRNPNGITKHKCAICGRTEKDDPNLEFRFCSRCNGNYEYCQDHLFTHEHVK